MKNFIKKVPWGTIIRTVGFFSVGMIGGIFAEQVAWPYLVEKPLFEEYNLEQRPVYVTQTEIIYIQENDALEKAVEKVRKTVIGIRTKTAQGKTIEGSGLAVTSDGLVVTLSDLVPQGSIFYFYSEGVPVKYQILKRDVKENLALVKIDKTNLTTASFGDMDKIKLGKRVFSVGLVFATSTPQETVNEGIIQRFSGDFIKANFSQKDEARGSILFDIEGNVLGINDFDGSGGVVSIPVSKIKIFAGF